MDEEDEPIDSFHLWGKTYTHSLQKINATKGLFDYFISEISGLYDENLAYQKFNTLSYRDYALSLQDMLKNEAINAVIITRFPFGKTIIPSCPF
jgi:hypothetical protein